MLRLAVIALSALAGVLVAQTAMGFWNGSRRDFSGSYVLYGGSPSPGEARQPSLGDAKVAFNIRGASAKELFDAIGPNRAANAPAQRACPSNRNIIVRERDALICRHAPHDEYWCTFGFDLSTGLSTWGAVGGQICEADASQPQHGSRPAPG